MNTILAAPTLLLVLLLGVFSPTSTHAQTCTTGETNDIVNVICNADNNERFGTLCSLLRSTGLDDVLLPSVNYRLFAPTDDAFQRAAGVLKGATIAQQRQTLLYHVTQPSVELECGVQQDSLLLLNTVRKTSTTVCTSTGDIIGQKGNVKIPINSDVPKFDAVLDLAPNPCNGRITPIDNLMGFGFQVYHFGPEIIAEPCSFFSKSCKAAKGAKGGFVVIEEEVDGIIFKDNIFVNGKSAKKSKKNAWGSFSQSQVYLNNNAIHYNSQLNYYDKSGKSVKQDKKGKGYYDAFLRGKAGKRERKLKRRLQ